MSDQYRRAVFSAEPGTLHERFVRALQAHVEETGQRVEATSITATLGTMLMQVWCVGIAEEERAQHMAEWRGVTASLAKRGLQLLADDRLQDTIVALNEEMHAEETAGAVSDLLAQAFKGGVQ